MIVVRGSSVFHPNMMRIIAYFFVHAYIFVITRIINFLYQIRLIDFSGLFRMPGVYTFGVILTLASSSGVIAIFVFYKNTKRLRSLIGVRSRYTLSERYQIKENIRAFKFLLIISLSASIVICLVFTLMTVRLFYRSDKFIRVICGASFDLMVSISFNTLGIVSILAQPTWKELMVEKIRRLRGKPNALAVFANYKGNLSEGEDAAISALAVVEFVSMTILGAFLLVVTFIVGQ
ncbi:hypothetical protein PMAYCL1PPCAC_01414 [Pristionchus mayeri]|uniref:G protein-coupled receptor n=1 Tax=Pristionchus mayeri TaxID=1317129 RepID=A0AAN5C6Y2_9BILA|nr:hypothetical protein PMAYCL1PPCAC_01414 [Pristionchus mayeri]